MTSTGTVAAAKSSANISYDRPSKRVTIEGRYEFPIFYEDTDLSGYVYHANYLKFFERARSSILGVERIRDLYEKGAHFVVAEANLRYRKPSFYGDTLVVTTDLTFTESPKTRVTHHVFRQGQEKPAVTGFVDLVLVNEKGAPLPPPPFFFEEFHGFETSC